MLVLTKGRPGVKQNGVGLVQICVQGERFQCSCSQHFSSTLQNCQYTAVTAWAWLQAAFLDADLITVDTYLVIFIGLLFV